MKKTLIGLILCSLMMLSIAVPVTATTEPKTASHPLTMGNTFYVGGLGPNNYTKIQDAINDSHDYDTVFVYDDSSPYYENLIIRRSINLRGENKNTTIINGSHGRNVTYINACNVTISGFTIQHIGETSNWYGIWVVGNDCTIEGNIIQNTEGGILFSNGPGHSIHPRGHRVVNNIIRHNGFTGIVAVIEGLQFTISGNIIVDNDDCGISLQVSSSIIIHNIISNNDYYGIIIFGSFNTITENMIQNNVHRKFRGTGIRIDGINNYITRNNLINNTRQGIQKNRGFITELFRELKEKNLWDANYWGEPLSEPKRISGLFIGDWKIGIGYLKGVSFAFLCLPWSTYDNQPAQEPYDIPSIGV